MLISSPINLSWKNIHLTPLELSHAAGIAEVVKDGELWNLWYTTIPRPEEVVSTIENRLEKQAAGIMIPFTVIDSQGKILGLTSYCNIDHDTPRVEIGYTFYARSLQGTLVNPAVKFLLLEYAFETLECVAVEFRTDQWNRHSQAAIQKLGARLDGILRHQTKLANGRVRNTMVYSILANEWPDVRRNLLDRLAS